MSNRDLHQVINKTMERKIQGPFESENTAQNVHIASDLDERINHNTNISEDMPPRNMPEKKGKSLADKRLKKAGSVMMAVFVGAMFMVLTFHPSESVDISEEASQAIEQQYSTSLPIGTRLMLEDESLEGKDLTIMHSSIADTTKIYVWDYAAEDGDYVQVLVDGTSLGDPFMIKNKPIKLEVPSIGEIQILGTRDGGGGITYAIHYDLNGTTYFNGTSVGDGNMYTLIKK